MQAIIFDMDGTLINTESPKTIEIISTNLKKFIPDWDREDNNHLVGCGIKTFHEFLQQKYDFKMDFQEFDTVWCALSNEMYRECADLFPGVASLLTSLQEANLPLAVATSNHSSNVEIVFKKLGLHNFFPIYVSEDHVNKIAKPAPDVYLKAALRLGIPPEQILSVEDSKNGITAALAANTICLSYTQQGHNPQDLKKAHSSFDCYTKISLTELKNIFHQHR